jgi:glycosyltransferase involved in cell wall biosynthesis
MIRPEPKRSNPSRPWDRQLAELWRAPGDYFDALAYDPEVGAAVRAKTASGKCDIVYMVSWNMRHYIEAAGATPSILEIGDNPETLIARSIPHISGLAHKARLYLDWYLIRRVLRRELRRYPEAVLLSSADASRLARHCRTTRLTVIPNGVDAARFQPARQETPGPAMLIFTGIMDYLPNDTAARYFIREVFPLIRRQVPGASFWAVGRDPMAALKSLHDPAAGIHVTGAVPDLRDYFNRATIYVCPLLSGAGIKNKILEAWAMKIPIVATGLSCEGINVEPGADIVVADSPRQFADAVVTLAADSEARRRLAENGRRKVEAQYSWEAAADQVERLLTEVTSRHAMTPTGRGDQAPG